MNLKTIYILITFFVSSMTFSQSDEIYGNWKPFAVDNGEFYLNSQTDSLSLYQEFDYIRNDSLKLIQFREIANTIYFSQQHNFKENGKYIQDLGVMVLQLDYKVDKARKFILASDNEFKNDTGTLELPFWLKDDVLYMEIRLTEPPIKLWLKK